MSLGEKERKREREGKRKTEEEKEEEGGSGREKQRDGRGERERTLSSPQRSEKRGISLGVTEVHAEAAAIRTSPVMDRERETPPNA